MRALVFAAALLLTNFVSAAETNVSFMIHAATGQLLPVGKYYWIHIENGVLTPTEIVIRSLTNTPDDPIDPPPPVDNLDKTLADLLVKVTADTEKKATAGKLAGLCDLLLAQVEAGTIKDVVALRKNIGMLVPVLVAMKKADMWKPFTDGVLVLTAKTDFAATVAVMKAVTVALKKV